MDQYTLTRKHLQSSLGSFWTEFFDDPTLLEGLSQGMSLHSRQLDQNNLEMQQITGVQTTPKAHVEVWNPLNLVRDRTTGSFYPLKYNPDSAVYGEPGTPPVHDHIFDYGDYTNNLGLSANMDIVPDDVMFLSDSIHDPSFIWVSGVHFEIRDGVFVFVDNIEFGERLSDVTETNLYYDQDVYKLWAYHCSYDMKYMAQQWGYLLSFEQDSSDIYNKALWELWKARRFGLTPDVFKELVSIYTGCPRCLTEGELVENLVQGPDGSVTVITDTNVYRVKPRDRSRVEVGDTLKLGEFIGTRVSVLEPGKSSFIRDVATTLDPHTDNKLLGDPGYIETNFIHFRAVDAPSTIKKSLDVNYSPSYAIISLVGGSYNVGINQMYRFGQRDFTFEIDVDMLPAPGTQVCYVQVFSVTGVPLFAEPYTGNIDAIIGTTTFITDREDILKVHPEALEDLVDRVDRTVLVTMFDDLETADIKETLEELRFSDDRRLSVTAYPSISVYKELPTEGASFSTVDRDQLLNYDMVILNTGSGVTSTLTPTKELQGGPSITDSEFIGTVVSNLDKRIAVLNKEISSIDNDVLWTLNYVHHDNRPTDTSWLYQVSGTRGVPRRNSTEGESFYSYGLFSDLDSELIDEHEINNIKTVHEFRIPVNPWPSSTGLGVISKDVNVPVYSKRIDIFGTRPMLETTLPPGEKYVYKVSSLQKIKD